MFLAKPTPERERVNKDREVGILRVGDRLRGGSFFLEI
jgi:hypothetical protein